MKRQEYLERREEQEELSLALLPIPPTERMEAFINEDLELQKYEVAHMDKSLKKVRLALKPLIMYKVCLVSRSRRITPNEFIVNTMEKALEEWEKE